MFDRIDHLMFAASDLDTGMDRIEELLGVRPVFGGRHPGFGTANALLSLGKNIYLEVIAPDPELEPPAQGFMFDLKKGEAKLITWILRAENIENLAKQAAEAGHALGQVLPGKRQTSDGTDLRWKLTDPYAMPLDGAVPFLIDWGDAPHPSGSAPSGGQLIGLRIEHPEPDKVIEALAALDVEMVVQCGQHFNLIATIETANGPVELR